MKRSRPAAFALALCALFGSACMQLAPGSPEPVYLRNVIVNGAEVSYIEQGRGDLVVLVHGTATDYRTFEPLLRHVGKGFRFVAYSRRHHWPNAWPDNGATYTLVQHADDLAALIRLLGADRAHVVAVSMGARVAAYAAVHHPDVVRTLVVSDGLLAPPSTEEGRRAMNEAGRHFEAMADRIRNGDVEGAVTSYVELVSPGRAWNALPPQWRRYYLDNARTLALALEDRTLRPPPCEALGKLRMPVLVLAGEHTPSLTAATNSAVLDCLPPGTGQAVVPSAAHFWYADNPDDGARLLTDFLRRHSLP